jgi:hypothetical protein
MPPEQVFAAHGEPRQSLPSVFRVHERDTVVMTLLHTPD